MSGTFASMALRSINRSKLFPHFSVSSAITTSQGVFKCPRNFKCECIMAPTKDKIRRCGQHMVPRPVQLWKTSYSGIQPRDAQWKVIYLWSFVAKLSKTNFLETRLFFLLQNKESTTHSTAACISMWSMALRELYSKTPSTTYMCTKWNPLTHFVHL